MDFLWFLSEHRTAVLDTFFSLVTHLGAETFILGFICVLFWCFQKQLTYRICSAFFMSGLTVQALKVSCRIPRPWVLDSTFSPVESAVAGATGYSFPSGHTQGITALFGTLAIYMGKNHDGESNAPTLGKGKQRGLIAICLLIIILVAFSRMYLGVHTPKDVLVAFGVTIVLSLVACVLYDKGVSSNGDLAGWVTLLFAGLAIATALLGLFFAASGDITWGMAADCYKSGSAGIGFALGWYIESHYIKFTKPKNVIEGIWIFVIGVVGVMLIKNGIKACLGSAAPVDIFRYVLMLMWVTAIWPWLFQKIRRRK